LTEPEERVSSRLFSNIPKPKDTRTQSQATDRKTQRLLTEEAPIGKIYVELENKKVGGFFYNALEKIFRLLY